MSDDQPANKGEGATKPDVVSNSTLKDSVILVIIGSITLIRYYIVIQSIPELDIASIPLLFESIAAITVAQALFLFLWLIPIILVVCRNPREIHNAFRFFRNPYRLLVKYSELKGTPIIRFHYFKLIIVAIFSFCVLTGLIPDIDSFGIALFLFVIYIYSAKRIFRENFFWLSTISSFLFMCLLILFLRILVLRYQIKECDFEFMIIISLVLCVLIYEFCAYSILSSPYLEERIILSSFIVIPLLVIQILLPDFSIQCANRLGFGQVHNYFVVTSKENGKLADLLGYNSKPVTEDRWIISKCFLLSNIGKSYLLSNDLNKTNERITIDRSDVFASGIGEYREQSIKAGDLFICKRGDGADAQIQLALVLSNESNPDILILYQGKRLIKESFKDWLDLNSPNSEHLCVLNPQPSQPVTTKSTTVTQSGVFAENFFRINGIQLNLADLYSYKDTMKWEDWRSDFNKNNSNLIQVLDK